MRQSIFALGCALCALTYPALAQERAANAPATTANAAQPPAGGPAPKGDDDDDKPGAEDSAIVVTARRLDAARDSIQPALGASSFKFDQETLASQVGGNNRSLSNTLAQAPGVTLDADGEIHIRNEHGNTQYRLNGVIIPESIGGFDETFDPRVASSIELITGTLPAQYGYRTSGVVNLTTQRPKEGVHGEVGIYGGSFGTIQPSLLVNGASGGTSYFASASYLRDDLGIENPIPGRRAIHDRTEQLRGFAYISQVLSDTSRISAFGGTAIGKFQIPNIPGVVPDSPFTYRGGAMVDSAALDQNERDTTHYGVIAYQYAGDVLNYQIAPFARYSLTNFSPDPRGGDIVINGFADQARLSSLAIGVQGDASAKLSDTHTLRFGLFAQNERTRSAIVTRALPGGGDPFVQTSDEPVTITDSGGRNGQLYGAYLQDEWSVTPQLTVNYGARFDAVRSFVREQQLSPRVNMVYKAPGGTTVHLGYARNFTPPPQELVTSRTLALFTGTVREVANARSDAVKSEREHYLDGGIEQKFGHATIAIDGYYKAKANLLDEGQFGSSQVRSPFNYARGYAWGVELRGDYTTQTFGTYLNVARGEERATRIDSAQYFFAPVDLDYTQNHYIFTDHSQAWTVSGGINAKLRNDGGELEPTLDFLYGDGLRAGDPAGFVPNGGKLPSYVVVNAGLAQDWSRGRLSGFTLRIDAVNLFDKSYQLRDGSGIGVGAPQFGRRRGVFVGLSKRF